MNLRKSVKEEIQTSINTLTEFQQYLDTILDKNQSVVELRPHLLGKEGSTAREYWRAVSAGLPNNIDFENRTRRPATDTFNAALNYLYGMLYTSVENALWSAGLTLTWGFFMLMNTMLQRCPLTLLNHFNLGQTVF